MRLHSGLSFIADDERSAHASSVAGDEHTVLVEADADELATATVSPELPKLSDEPFGTPMNTKNNAIEEHEN